jgi:Tat protein secretion system quality control protein TatD with DNase activity
MGQSKGNDSRNIPIIAASIAKIKGLTFEETESITTQNAFNFYKIKL